MNSSLMERKDSKIGKEVTLAKLWLTWDSGLCLTLLSPWIPAPLCPSFLSQKHLAAF